MPIIRKAYTENAIAEYTDSLKKAPDNPVILYHLGLAYHKRGEDKIALSNISEALKISKKFPGARDAERLMEEIKK